jgi:hypothetical protein
MRARLVAGAIGLVALLLSVSPANAGWMWCAKDPVVRLDGTSVQILVAVPQELQTAVTGPIQVVISVPAGVSTELVSTDAGFNDFGETVRFVTDPNLPKIGNLFIAQVRVTLPTAAGAPPLPTMLTITPENGAARSTTGTSTFTFGLALLAGDGS